MKNIFDKNTKAINWRKGHCFQEIDWDNRIPICQKQNKAKNMNSDLQLALYKILTQNGL